MFSLFKFAALATLLSVAHAYTGDATWYEPNGGNGACGAPNQNWEYLVALPPSRYNNGAHCYKHVTVQYGNKLVDATVVDLCPSCKGDSIDLSPPAFSALANLDVGRMQVNWWYN